MILLYYHADVDAVQKSRCIFYRTQPPSAISSSDPDSPSSSQHEMSNKGYILLQRPSEPREHWRATPRMSKKAVLRATEATTSSSSCRTQMGRLWLCGQVLILHILPLATGAVGVQDLGQGPPTSHLVPSLVTPTWVMSSRSCNLSCGETPGGDLH